MGWQDDKAWADRYLPAIEAVVRSVAGRIISVVVADDNDDMHRATDYVIKVEGRATELEKIKSGFARWYLYAWAQDDSTFVDWIFVDLDALRNSGLLSTPRRSIQNKDGSSGFVALSLRELRQANCLLAEAQPTPLTTAYGRSDLARA